MSEDFPLTVTLKGKGAYDPWIVVKGKNPDEVRQRVEAVVGAGLGTAVADAAKKFGDQAPTTYASQDNNSQSTGSAWGDGGSSSSGYAAGPDELPEDPGRPAGNAPQCEHGPKLWRNPPDKPWQGWFCSAKKRAGSCKTDWIND